MITLESVGDIDRDAQGDVLITITLRVKRDRLKAKVNDLLIKLAGA